MPFNLYPYAAVLNGYVTRFINTDTDIVDGEVALPVIADPDPPLAFGQYLSGPDYEVFPDHVRAYGTAVDLDPDKVPRLTFAQLLIGLYAEGWITEAEGDGWLAGTLPAPVLALIDTLPMQQRFAAKARALRPSEVLRHDPLVEMLGAAQGKTPEELDTFFNTYAGV